MAGVHEDGSIDEHEYIFDIYTKEYDFQSYDVKAKSMQDIKSYVIANWNKYKARYRGEIDKLEKEWIERNRRGERLEEMYGFIRKKIDVYSSLKFFVSHHSNGHYVFDECPITQKSSRFDGKL